MEYTILFIDDEPDLLEILAQDFRNRGYQTSQAQNGVEALAMLNQDSDRFDVIVSDLSMPKMNGMELLKEIRRIGIETPFIFFSGYSDKTQMVEAKQYGAMDFIEKPHSPEHLMTIIQKGAELGRNNKRKK